MLIIVGIGDKLHPPYLDLADVQAHHAHVRNHLVILRTLLLVHVVIPLILPSLVVELYLHVVEVHLAIIAQPTIQLSDHTAKVRLHLQLQQLLRSQSCLVLL